MWPISTDTERTTLDPNYVWEEDRANVACGARKMYYREAPCLRCTRKKRHLNSAEAVQYKQGHNMKDNAKNTSVSLATGQGSNLQSRYHAAALNF